MNSYRWRIRDDCILIFRASSRPQSSCHVNAQDFDRPLGMQSRNPDPCESSSRCVVLVPCQGRIVSQCQSALLELERRGYVVRRIEGYSAIDQARNQIASDALADGFQETLWIDSDVGFDPDDVDKIRRHDLPIVCGIYPKRANENWRFIFCRALPAFASEFMGGCTNCSTAEQDSCMCAEPSMRR